MAWEKQLSNFLTIQPAAHIISSWLTFEEVLETDSMSVVSGVNLTLSIPDFFGSRHGFMAMSPAFRISAFSFGVITCNCSLLRGYLDHTHRIKCSISID